MMKILDFSIASSSAVVIDLVPFLELVVINEGVNSPFPVNIVEIASETITSIFPSEAKEHIVRE